MAKQIPRKSRRVISAVHLNKDEAGELTLNLTHEYQWRTGAHTYFANGEPAQNTEPTVGTIAIAKTYRGISGSSSLTQRSLPKKLSHLMNSFRPIGYAGLHNTRMKNYRQRSSINSTSI